MQYLSLSKREIFFYKRICICLIGEKTKSYKCFGENEKKAFSLFQVNNNIDERITNEQIRRWTLLIHFFTFKRNRLFWTTVFTWKSDCLKCFHKKYEEKRMRRPPFCFHANISSSFCFSSSFFWISMSNFDARKRKLGSFSITESLR